MSTNQVSTTLEPVDKKQSLQTIKNFLMRLIMHFNIETTKAKMKTVPSGGSIIEGFPVISEDWVTVQVSHNCLSKAFVEFIQEKLNPILISKGFSRLNAVILHSAEMSFCVEFAAKAITPHRLPIKGDEALFDLFAKNWNEVYTKHFKTSKTSVNKGAIEIVAQKRKEEVRSLLKNETIKKVISGAFVTLNLKLATASKVSSLGASFMVTVSSKKDSVMADIDKISAIFKKLFGEKGVSVLFSYPGQDKSLPHTGYWIKIEYQALKDFAEKNGVSLATSTSSNSLLEKKSKKEEKASIVKKNKEERQKRKAEMTSLIPVLREKVTPLVKESLGLSIHTIVSSGASVLVTTQISKKNSDPGNDKVVKVMESAFGVGYIIVSGLKNKGIHAGYSIAFPYEKAIKIFNGTLPPAAPIVKKTNPVKDELSEWAVGIIAGALKHATDVELMSEMSDRGDSDLKILEKFISGLSNETLIAELGKRVSDMKPEEKLKLIQLFSK